MHDSVKTKSIVMRIAVVVFVVMLHAAYVAAQDAPPVEVAAGYAFLNDRDSAYTFPAGWMVSVGAHVTPWLDLVADGGGSYKTLSIPGDRPQFKVYSVMGGPRVRFAHVNPISPFAQVLFGAARATTTVVDLRDVVTDFAYQPGAGLDVALRRDLAARFEVDYRIIRAESQNSKEWRIVLAAVLGIGR